MSSAPGPAPAGMDPNDSRASTIIGVVCFVLSIATIALSLRIYTRRYILGKFGLDDWLACIAFGLVWACGFCVAWNTKYGFGRHIYWIDPASIKLYLRTFYVSIVMYNAALMAIKMTFLTQYYRVLAVTERIRKVYIAALIIVAGWSISQVLVEIFICSPIDAYWDPSVQGRCIPNYPQWYINAAGNIISDIIVFVLPLPVISRLNLGRGQKIILMFIFCLGFFTCMISFIRIRFLHLTEDHTWDNIESAGWSIGELCSGLTCACLPTFRPLMARWFPSFSSAVRTTAARLSHKGTTSSSTGNGWSQGTRDLEKGAEDPGFDATAVSAGGILGTGIARPAWSRRGTGDSRPAWSRHASGPAGESQEDLRPAAPAYMREKSDDSEDSGRPMILQRHGDIASDESMGIPIMRPNDDASVETRIAAGGAPDLGNAPYRISTEIRRTTSRREIAPVRPAMAHLQVVPTASTRVRVLPAGQRPSFESQHRPSFESQQRPSFEARQRPSFEARQRPSFEAQQRPSFSSQRPAIVVQRPSAGSHQRSVSFSRDAKEE